MLTELHLRNMPLTLELVVGSYLELHSANQHSEMERLSIADDIDHTSEYDPSSPIVSFPHLRPLVLSNMSLNHLYHLKVPRGAHLRDRSLLSKPQPGKPIEAWRLALHPQEDRRGEGEDAYRHRACWVCRGKVGPPYAIGGLLRSFLS